LGFLQEIISIVKTSNIHENKNLIESYPYTNRIYGAPKVQKEGIPIRHIVNTIGGHTYNIAKYLAKKLRPLVGNIESFVKYSSHFINEINNIKLDKNNILVSFNVTSL